MMDEHVRVGRKYPTIRLNTTYSYGLDDQEFVVAFEGDNPAEFLDLVMELREVEASSYTLRDTPTLTCVQMSLWDLLDTLGGASATRSAAPATRGDGFTPVSAVAELPPGASKRVYAAAEAVALFNVGGTIHAIANRCTHAPLARGRVLTRDGAGAGGPAQPTRPDVPGENRTGHDSHRARPRPPRGARADGCPASPLLTTAAS